MLWPKKLSKNPPMNPFKSAESKVPSLSAGSNVVNFGSSPGVSNVCVLTVRARSAIAAPRISLPIEKPVSTSKPRLYAA